MTRQIRVYEETARLIEEISRRVPGRDKPTFAEIVELWAQKVHPDFYSVISNSSQAIEAVLGETDLNIYVKQDGNAGQGE